MDPEIEELFEGLENDSDELSHYGRKGMKWYQHIFGKEPKASSSGGKRSTESNDNRGHGQRNDRNTATKIQTANSRKQAKARAKRLSDRDLDNIIRRIEQENKYVSLTYKPSVASKFGGWIVSNGQRAVGNAASKTAEQAIINYINKKWPQTKRDK